MEFAVTNKIPILPSLCAGYQNYLCNCFLYLCYLFLQNLISLLEEFPAQSANKQGFIFLYRCSILEQ